MSALANPPALVDRLFLFGAVARRPPRRYEKPPSAPAWQIVTLEAQWARFTEDVPAQGPPVLSRAHFEAWGERYLDSDPDSRRYDPVGVKVPTGPFNDIIHAWHGELAYDPTLVQAPVAIIRGVEFHTRPVEGGPTNIHDLIRPPEKDLFR